MPAIMQQTPPSLIEEFRARLVALKDERGGAFADLVPDLVRRFDAAVADPGAPSIPTPSGTAPDLASSDPTTTSDTSADDVASDTDSDTSGSSKKGKKGRGW